MSYMVSELRAQVSNGELEDAVTATLSDSKANTDIKFSTLQGGLTLKANQSTTYTKTENDTALALKANQSTTYIKTENDTIIHLFHDSISYYEDTLGYDYIIYRN